MTRKPKVSARKLARLRTEQEARERLRQDMQDRGQFRHLKRRALEKLARDHQDRLLNCARVCKGLQEQILTQSRHVQAAEEETARVRLKLGESEVLRQDLLKRLTAAEAPQALVSPQSVLSYYEDENSEKAQDLLLFLRASIPYLEGLQDSSGLSDEGVEYVQDAINALQCFRRLVGLLESKNVPFATGVDSANYGEPIPLPRGLERQAE